MPKPKKYHLPSAELLEEVKKNLILQHSEDDAFLEGRLLAALQYAAEWQHKGAGYYNDHPMPLSTRQAVMMLASHWYESRDGSTGGFFGDKVEARDRVVDTVHDLLRMNKEVVF